MYLCPLWVANSSTAMNRILPILRRFSRWPRSALKMSFTRSQPTPRNVATFSDGGDAAQVHDQPSKGFEIPCLPLGERDRLPAPGPALGAGLDVASEDDLLALAPHRQADEGPLELPVQGA